MLPMWSPSSWERKTQRTSAGSTTELTASQPALAEAAGRRCRRRPAPRRGSRASSRTRRCPAGPGRRLGIRNVSGAMRCGVGDGERSGQLHGARSSGGHGRVLSVGGRIDGAHCCARPRLIARLTRRLQAPAAGDGAATIGRCGSGCSGRWRSPTTTGTRSTSAVASRASCSPRSSRPAAARSSAERADRGGLGRPAAGVGRRDPAELRVPAAPCARRAATPLVLDHAGYRLDLTATRVDVGASRSWPTPGTASWQPGRPVAARRALRRRAGAVAGPALLELVDHGRGARARPRPSTSGG